MCGQGAVWRVVKVGPEQVMEAATSNSEATKECPLSKGNVTLHFDHPEPTLPRIPVMSFLGPTYTTLHAALCPYTTSVAGPA
jgi:hypothetical protein